MFPPTAKILVFAVTFVVLLGVQTGVVWKLHGASRQAMVASLGTELPTVARSVESMLAIPLQRDLPSRELDALIRRVREANGLDSAMIVDREARLLVSDVGAPRGAPANVLAVTPAIARATFDDGASRHESFQLQGESYRRLYYPIHKDGAPWGVLCLEGFDPSPTALAALRFPLAVGLAASAILALGVAGFAIVMMRHFDRVQVRLLRMERFATAGNLAASIAHEVKNPMGIILSTTQLMQRSASLDPGQRRLLRGIEEEVRRAEGQLDAFLDTVRDTPLKKNEEDLVAVVRGTVEFMAARAAQCRVRLTNRLPESPVIVSVDRSKLRQALINLLLNAIDAQAPGGGEIRLEVARDPGRDRTSVTIHDDGPGMTEAQKELALEPFHSANAGGTGLGLPLARQIAERHGGRLDIETSPGAGTKVTLSLPLAGAGA